MTRRRVAWVYQGDHTRHPFIRIACDDLAASGDDVTVVDLAATPGLAGAYIHTPAASRRSSQRAGHGLIARGVRHTNFLVRAIILIAHARPDVLICTMPAALAAGSIVAKVRGSRLVYYPFELFGEQVGRTSATLRLLERFLLKHAVDAVVTQNEERARVYVEERSCRVEPHIVHNFKPTAPLPPKGTLRAHLGLSAETRVILYEGALVPGRWLDRLIESSAHLPPDSKLVFIGESNPWWEDQLRSARVRLGHLPICVIPFVAHENLPRYIVDANVGVIIYDDTVRNHVFCEPGKLSDYISANVPVVAPDFPTIRRLVVQRGLGRTFHVYSPEAIALAITEALDSGEGTWNTALAAARQTMTWETQRINLLRALLP